MVASTFDKYALYCFTIQQPLTEEYFWFEYNSSRYEKNQRSIQCPTKDFNQPVNYMLNMIFESSSRDPDIVRMHMVEELCTLALMVPNDNEFLKLYGCVEGMRDYKKRFYDTAKTF